MLPKTGIVVLNREFNGVEIRVVKYTENRFSVCCGPKVAKDLTALEASHELGECIMAAISK